MLQYPHNLLMLLKCEACHVAISQRLHYNIPSGIYFSGYSAHSYELLQVPPTSRSNSITNSRELDANTCRNGDLPQCNLDKKVSTVAAEHSDSTAMQTLSVNVTDSDSGNLLHAKSSGSIGISPLQGQKQMLGDLSKPETHSLVLSNKSKEGHSQDDFHSSLIAPCNANTEEGRGVFEDLYFPPLPPPDISQLAAPFQSKLSLPQINSNSSLLSSSQNALGIVAEDEESSTSDTNHEVDKSLDSETVPDTLTKTSPSSPGHSHGGNRRRLAGQDSLIRIKKSNSKIMDLAKDKFLNSTRENYCPTGNQYVVCVV